MLQSYAYTLLQSVAVAGLLSVLTLLGPRAGWSTLASIGATEAVCDLVGFQADLQRNHVFRQVVSVIFDDRMVRSAVNPVEHDRRPIELFESAGAEAVAACMRGDRKLGYFLEALRVSGLRGR